MPVFSLKNTAIALAAGLAAVARARPDSQADLNFGFSNFTAVGNGTMGLQTSDGQAATLFAGAGVANGNDTLGYNGTVFAQYSPADASAVNCSINVIGSAASPLVLTPSVPNGTYLLPNATSAAAFNETLQYSLQSVCYGNSTLNTTLTVFNGNESSPLPLDGSQINIEAPPSPPAGCVDGTISGAPLIELLPEGHSFTVSGIGFNQTDGAPDTQVMPVCDFGAVMEGCPINWTGSDKACQGPVISASDTASAFNGMVITNENVAFPNSATVPCSMVPVNSSCLPFANITLAKVTAPRLEVAPQAA